MEIGTSLAHSIAIIQYEAMLFALAGLLIGGIDDFLLDLFYLIREARRRLFVFTRHRRMTSPNLPPPHHPGVIAIFIPAWDEAEVIGAMLKHTLTAWGSSKFRIFVGTYPNDPATIRAVADIAHHDARVSLVILPHAGRTTKADCLNHLWQAMLRHEAEDATLFKAIVLHDAEDVVHADEICLFDTMIERFDMVQLPVRPLISQQSQWIAGHYADEFAEAHGKHLVLREAIGAAVPSAGVGCAFARAMMHSIAEERGGLPFDAASLTEDYEIGLRLAERGGRTAFIVMRDAKGDLICTQEHFPDRLGDAIRQKARWFVGISLAGWDRLGWRGSWREHWMRLHDRRAGLAALVLFATYIASVGYCLIAIFAAMGLIPPTDYPPAVRLALTVTFYLMLWRLAFRFFWSTHAYGLKQGLRAIPRTIIANFVAMLAARRAIGLYIDQLRHNTVVWEKTRHRFPGAEASTAKDAPDAI